jgi:Lar family restriction alleviation protein
MTATGNNNDDRNNELLPCPFCGGRNLEIHPDFAEDDNNRIYAYHVQCNHCQARGGNEYPICWCETEQQAIERWNDRYVPPVIHGEEKDRLLVSSTAMLNIFNHIRRIRVQLDELGIGDYEDSES